MSKSLLIAALLSGLLFYSCSSTSTNPATKFEVTLSADPSEGGNVSPAIGEYEEGSILEISATPNEGWLFIEWVGDYSGSNPTTTITVDSNKNVTAVFEKKSYNLTITTSGEGTVDEKVITAKDTDYDHGTMVELTSNPATGWSFVEWQGAITGSQNPQTITMDEAKNVTAVFEKKNYALTINTTGQGGVSEELISQKKTDYEYDSVVKLTASPVSGWTFVEWKGDLSGSTNPQQINVDSPKNVTAVFEKKYYEFVVNTTGQGSVTKIPNQQEYEHGSTVDLIASTTAGWEFSEWQGDLAGSKNPQSITLDEVKNITAVFEKKNYELTINTTGQGSITKNPDQQEYEYQTIVELTANAESGWRFVEWQGAVSSNNNLIELTIDNPKELTAVFIEEMPLFYLAENGVTIKCEEANVGDTGTVNGITYTKRSSDQINSFNAQTTCTSDITNMYRLFYSNSSFNEDISSWDVSSVTNMNSMFSNADSFNGDLGSWDVGSVTDMDAMFFNAGSFNNGEINNWNVSNVTNMESMFGNADSFNQDLNNWDVSSVTNMNSMFSRAYDFNGKVGSWNVSNVTDMEDMFYEAESFNQKLNNWNVSSVTTMSHMFYGALSFDQNLGSWNVVSVTTMVYMFYEASSFNGNIGTWNLSSIENMDGMFSRAESFNQNLNNWNVSTVLNMDDLFNEAINFNGNISDWDVSDVTSMEGMFQSAESFNQDISNWDVGDVRDMDYMFDEATVFDQDLSSWCVIRINSIPNNFSTGSSLSDDHKPIWGRCR